MWVVFRRPLSVSPVYSFISSLCLPSAARCASAAVQWRPVGRPVPWTLGLMTRYATFCFGWPIASILKKMHTKIQPPKFDVIIQKCWSNILQMPKMPNLLYYLFLFFDGVLLDFACSLPDYNFYFGWINCDVCAALLQLACLALASGTTPVSGTDRIQWFVTVVRHLPHRRAQFPAVWISGLHFGPARSCRSQVHTGT